MVAIALGEPGAPAVARRIRGFDTLVAANLVEAEVRAALAREDVRPDGNPVATLATLTVEPRSASFAVATWAG